MNKINKLINFLRNWKQNEDLSVWTFSKVLIWGRSQTPLKSIKIFPCFDFLINDFVYPYRWVTYKNIQERILHITEACNINCYRLHSGHFPFTCKYVHSMYLAFCHPGSVLTAKTKPCVRYLKRFPTLQ